MSEVPLYWPRHTYRGTSLTRCGDSENGRAHVVKINNVLFSRPLGVPLSALDRLYLGYLGTLARPYSGWTATVGIRAHNL